jgi:hypothetical protein
LSLEITGAKMLSVGIEFDTSVLIPNKLEEVVHVFAPNN